MKFSSGGTVIIESAVTNVLFGGTWIQKRERSAGVGADWSVSEEFLPDGYGYEVLEYGGKVFLWKADGLYVNGTSTGVAENREHNGNGGFRLYQNPSNGGLLTVESAGNISAMEVVNILGQVVYRPQVKGPRVQFQAHLPTGIYYLRVHTRAGIETAKFSIAE